MNSKKLTVTGVESQDPWQELPFDPWLIVATIRRSWRWAVPLGLVIACFVSGFIYWRFVPEYLASHLLEANRDFVVFQGVMQGHADLLQNERPLIENHLVLSPVLSDAKICEAPSLRDIHSREMNIRRNLSLSDAGSKTLMRVSYRDTDPVAAANVCNAIVRWLCQCDYAATNWRCRCGLPAIEYVVLLDLFIRRHYGIRWFLSSRWRCFIRLDCLRTTI